MTHPTCKVTKSFLHCRAAINAVGAEEPVTSLITTSPTWNKSLLDLNHRFPTRPLLLQGILIPWKFLHRPLPLLSLVSLRERTKGNSPDKSISRPKSQTTHSKRLKKTRSPIPSTDVLQQTPTSQHVNATTQTPYAINIPKKLHHRHENASCHFHDPFPEISRTNPVLVLTCRMRRP